MSRLVILEGPDGAGKSTLAELFRQAGYHYVHCGSFPRVKKHLARLYVEAMAPALLGLADVVMDRCWLSEAIYGDAFRSGEDRLGQAHRRMLERVAARCQTSVVLCLPPEEACVRNWAKRKSDEYLDDERYVRAVYWGYVERRNSLRLTSLPLVSYDYTLPGSHADVYDATLEVATQQHLHGRGAGVYDAPVVLLGESLAQQGDADPFFRAPFVAFDRGGCSAWLTDQLEDAGISERSLLWLNADDAEAELAIAAYPRRAVIAMGNVAQERVSGMTSISHVAQKVFHVDHPQFAKRFHHRDPYPLVRYIKEAL